MKITTRQAAERLGVTDTTVRTMVKAGTLTDVAKNGTDKRHVLQLDSRQVNELRKTYVNRKGKSVKRRRATTASTGGAMPQVFKELSGRWHAIDRRLEAIEGQLADIIRMWS